MKSDVKLLLQAYSFHHRTFFEMLDAAMRLGFDAIEAFPGHTLGGGLAGSLDYRSITPETLQEVKRRVDRLPVKILSYGVASANTDAEWTKLMETCRALGAKQVVIEAGLSKEAYDRAEAFAGRYGMRVALHNHVQAKGMPKPMLESLAGRGPLIGVGADIGHWVRGGENALAGIRLLKGKILSIHLADVAPKSCGYRDLPLGSGVTDVKGVLDELAAQGGTVYATVEYETASATLDADVAACVRFFRAWERDEIVAGDRVAAKNLAAIWRNVKTSAVPDTWPFPAGAREGIELGKKTAGMHRLELDPASFKANKPGVCPAEEVAMGFGDDPKRKFNQHWSGNGFAQCALRQPGTPKVYAVSSSNDASMRDPRDWKLWGSEDGKSWFELDARRDQFFMERFQLKAFEIAKPRACRFLKFEVLAQGGDADMQFSRLGFFD